MPLPSPTLASPTSPTSPASGTSPIDALRKMKARMPNADAAVSSGVNAANLLKAQQLAGQAPANTTSTQINQAGAGLAAAAGQAQVAKTAAPIQQSLQSAQNVLGAREMEAKSSAAGRELAVAAAQRGNELRLSEMDSELKREMIDARTEFATNEAGRTVLNSQQLADLAIFKATNREELASKIQMMEQTSKRKLLLTELMYKKAMQDLDFQTRQAIQSGNQQAQQNILDYKNQIQAAFAKEIADAKNNAALFTTGMGIAGAIVGSFWGPAGTSAGYAVGSGVGAATANTGAADKAFNTK